MATELIGGAALGTAFTGAKDLVKDFIVSAIEFKPILLEFEATLNSLEPFFAEITRARPDQVHSQELARQLLDILNEIEPVVRKCKDDKLKFWRKPKYTKKLQKLDKKLRGFFELNGLAKLLVDNEEILEKLDDLGRKLDKMVELHSNSKPLSPLDLPDHKIFGLKKPIEDLKNMVFDNDSCGPVVITALPGSGKTTLATMFCHDPQIKEKFGDHIFFVTVSSKPELESLKELANMIKETKEDHDTLLDDVWPNGENIIKQFVFKKSGYKILVTSRSSFPTLDGSRVYEVQKLSEKDAEAVFRDAAKPDPELKVDDLVKTIVKGCRESPLALKLIGGSLYKQPKVSWTDKITKWSEGGSVFDSKDVRDVVKTSLDSLDDDGLFQEKECYLDLGSFPEDQRIPATALRDIWVEKYGHDEAGAITLHCLYKLSTRNLIKFKLPSKDVDRIEGSSNDYYVQQHDLLRDLVINCSSRDREEERTRLIANIHKNEFLDWWAQQKNLDKAELLSISTGLLAYLLKFPY